jgi:hypothetical protein
MNVMFLNELNSKNFLLHQNVYIIKISKLNEK